LIFVLAFFGENKNIRNTWASLRFA